MKNKKLSRRIALVAAINMLATQAAPLVYGLTDDSSNALFDDTNNDDLDTNDNSDVEAELKELEKELEQENFTD